MSAPTRKTRTNVTFDAALLEDARALRLNVSAVSEVALRKAVRQAKAKAWHEENAEALREHEAWLRQHGHPLAEFMPHWAKEAWDAWRKEPGD